MSETLELLGVHGLSSACAVLANLAPEFVAEYAVEGILAELVFPFVVDPFTNVIPNLIEMT